MVDSKTIVAAVSLAVGAAAVGYSARTGTPAPVAAVPSGPLPIPPPAAKPVDVVCPQIDGAWCAVNPCPADTPTLHACWDVPGGMTCRCEAAAKKQTGVP